MSRECPICGYFVSGGFAVVVMVQPAKYADAPDVGTRYYAAFVVPGYIRMYTTIPSRGAANRHVTYSLMRTQSVVIVGIGRYQMFQMVAPENS